jgi:allantoate deiminase
MRRRLHGVAGELLARLDILAALTAEVGGARQPFRTAERARAKTLVGGWMRDAGMTVRSDPAGNLIGRYEAGRPDAPALLIGSRLETSVDSGRFDGPLGALAGIAVVHSLAREERRLPFAVEVAAFADEAGIRLAADPAGALAPATQPPAAARVIPAAAIPYPRPAASAGRPTFRKVLAYVEPRAEQGPVLDAEDLPLGIGSAVAGQTRLAVSVEGQGGHAGAVPMGLRRDALAAAAEMALLVERRCSEEGLVGTVGRLWAEPAVPDAIPAACRFDIDVRAGEDGLRDLAVGDIREGFAEIARRRRLACWIEETRRVPAVRCDEGLRRQLAAALEEEGLPVRELPCGAGHDAMAMAGLCPAGMLLVRCRGAARRPGEWVAVEDLETALRTLYWFARELGAEEEPDGQARAGFQELAPVPA